MENKAGTSPSCQLTDVVNVTPSTLAFYSKDESGKANCSVFIRFFSAGFAAAFREAVIGEENVYELKVGSGKQGKDGLVSKNDCVPLCGALRVLVRHVNSENHQGFVPLAVYSLLKSIQRSTGNLENQLSLDYDAIKNDGVLPRMGFTNVKIRELKNFYESGSDIYESNIEPFVVSSLEDILSLYDTSVDAVSDTLTGVRAALQTSKDAVNEEVEVIKDGAREAVWNLYFHVLGELQSQGILRPVDKKESAE